MILAAPLVIPFAEAVGISIATLGMAKAADMVNDYIQENPEQSIKILSTIVPGVGIGEIFMKKGKDEEVEEEVEVEDVDARDLTRAEKAKMMKELAKSGGGNMREKMKKGYEEIIQPGESDRELDDAEDRYDGGLEEVSKPKFDYKKFFKKRYADGGAIGIEVLFEEKKPRQGLFMGGPALTGQPLAIYNSMKAYQSFTDQEIANAIKEAGYELPTADSGTTPPGSTPGNNLGYQSGNEGQGGIMNLDPYSKGPASPGNQSNTSSKYSVAEIEKGIDIYGNPIDESITSKGFIGSAMDKFSSLPGIKQGKNLINTIMDNTLVGRIAAMRNPLNPNASNYNPSLQGQIDMLGGMTGTKISGTYIDPYNKQLGFTDNLTGQPMTGRDPNSGLGVYGPGSVLAGQNVVSGFGTNDYEDQLQGYIDRMLDRRTKGVLTEFQEKKLEAAYAELERAKTQAIEDAAKKKREMDAKIAAAEKLKEITEPTFNPNTTSGGVGTYDPTKDHSGDGGYGNTGGDSYGDKSGSRSRDNRSSDLGFSDIRLKENVELIGKSPSNINIYKFNYKDNPTTYQGAMAHEVPWASVKHSNGYMMIDYNQIDVDFKKI